MAYDAATSQLVLFSGSGAAGAPRDTWTWDGSTWTQQSPAASPPARYYASMAYDPATSQLVLFGGGMNSTGIAGDTWTWDGTTWTQQSPATRPAARFGASMAYDPATSQLVLFGGIGLDGLPFRDTWTWDGTTWTQQSPAASPPARYQASMAYDAATSQLVLFGGVGGPSGIAGDTWTWDGTTWTQQSPATSPPARYNASMAYDPATSQLVLFGGAQSTGIIGDTWTWDGTTWTQQSPATSPPARYAASMAYDPATSQLILFGGYRDDGWRADTWTYTGGRQSQSITFSSTAPSSARYSGANDQTYTATATATSGLPVTLSVDSSSTSGCAISGGTVSYGSGAGTCIIDASQPGNSSYLPAAQVTQRFTISPAPLSITASSPAMTYGGTVPAITPSYSGFAGHDSPSSLSAPPSCSTTATSASPAGTYPSTCSGAADPNYTISYKPRNRHGQQGHHHYHAHRAPRSLGTPAAPQADRDCDSKSKCRNPGRRCELLCGNSGSPPQAPGHRIPYHHRHRGLHNHNTGLRPPRLYAVYIGNANDKGSTSATIRCGRYHRHTGGSFEVGLTTRSE